MAFNYLDPNPGGHPDVLFLHGLGADSEMWGYQLLTLAEAGMRPVAVDLPGFGKTPMNGRNWKFQEITRDLAIWGKKLFQGKVFVVGLSLGGVFAQNLAVDFPEQVGGLVLASTFTQLRPRTWRSWIYLISRGMKVFFRDPAAQAEEVANHLFPDASQAAYHQMVVEKIRRANPIAYRKAMRGMVRLDNRQRVRNLRLPVLVLTGERDGTVSAAAQGEMAQTIPGARQLVLPDAGHAVNVDQPGLFNQHLLDFIRSIDR